MAEDCKCTKLGEFKHIAEDMADRKNNERDMQKNISDIRTSQEKTMFVTEQVQKAQELQTITAKENQVEVARTNKEYKTTMDAGFKAIEDRRIADEKATLLEKKEADKEKVRLRELRDAKDEDLRKEKRAQTRAIYMVILVLIVNTLYGLLKVYFPKFVGL